jgi:D-glycero-D-manno-heptose 1,7-bisphosphate phosphatase
MTVQAARSPLSVAWIPMQNLQKTRSSMIRAVFLDRDGVINRKPLEGEYVTCWEDFHILPGVVEGIALLKQAGFCVLVVTNQRCIAKGLMSVADLENIHQRMSDLLKRAGAAVDGVYYCPHEQEPPCNCRKPAPGMLLEAASSRGIDLSASWMIGDSDIDVEAGINAGCKTARLLTSSQAVDEPGRSRGAAPRADIVAASLLDVIGEILRAEETAAGSSMRDRATT